MKEKKQVGDGRSTGARLERIAHAAAAAGFVVTGESPRLIAEKPKPPAPVLRMPWNGDSSGPPRLRDPHPEAGPYLQLFDPETGEDLTAEEELALDEQAWHESRGGAE